MDIKSGPFTVNLSPTEYKKTNVDTYKITILTNIEILFFLLTKSRTLTGSTKKTSTRSLLDQHQAIT